MAPDLGVTQEEALLRGEAIEFFLFDGAVFKAADQSHEGQPNAGIVGAIFAQREPPVEIRAFHGAEAGILFVNAIHPFLEFRGILLGPPITQIAVGIELAALVVKAMGEFVTDNRANTAKVEGHIGVSAIERRLQDAGGKIDVVLQRAVVGIHGGRSHAELSSIHRFADFIQVAVNFDIPREFRTSATRLFVTVTAA